MKIIQYHFADGTSQLIEVNDEIAKTIDALKKEDENTRKKYFRHCLSLDAIVYEGSEYGRCDFDCSDQIDTTLLYKIYYALGKLTIKQIKRLLLFSAGLSIHYIAEIENISFFSAWKSIDAAKKAFATHFQKII